MSEHAGQAIIDIGIGHYLSNAILWRVNTNVHVSLVQFPYLDEVALSLRYDFEAVRNRLICCWDNDPVEDKIRRLKMIKMLTYKNESISTRLIRKSSIIP